jgi:hypothetical protein
MRWVGHAQSTSKMSNAFRILVGKREGKVHSEDLSINGWILRWIVRKIGFTVGDWIHVAQDTDQWRPFVNTVMNICVP